MLIGGGLAAAVSAAYLLRQRRHARTYRPATPDLDQHPADPHPPRHGTPRVDGTPDDIAASIRAALDPPTAPGHAHPGVEPGRPATTSPPAPTHTGAGGPGEPSVAPVVRRLHYAYHRRPRPDGLAELTGTAAAGPPAPPWLLPADGSDPARRTRPRLLVPFGLTPGGATVPVDLTSTPALVLADHTPHPHATPDEGAAAAAAGGSVTRSGDRAEDVARALLLTIAAGMRTLTGDPLGHVVITIADLRHLLGITSPGPRTVELPGTLRVVDDLDAALDDLEVALAHRAPSAGPRDPVEAPVVLIATAPRPGTPTARMQRLLEAGHPHRVCAVLLGDWPTPTRVAVGEDAHRRPDHGSVARRPVRRAAVHRAPPRRARPAHHPGPAQRPGSAARPVPARCRARRRDHRRARSRASRRRLRRRLRRLGRGRRPRSRHPGGGRRFRRHGPGRCRPRPGRGRRQHRRALSESRTRCLPGRCCRCGSSAG